MSISLKTARTLLIQHDLYKEITHKEHWHYSLPTELATTRFESISYHSLEVDKQTLFFVKGLNFKEEYLQKAIMENGLRFYVAETTYDVEATGLIVKDIKKAMAILSMAFYDYPQNKLKLIGFTGTKGKTTAAYFAKSILSQATNHRCAMLSTMNTTLDGVNYFKSELTTPESLDLFRMMKEALDNQMTHLVMEVSSQAYKTQRVYGLLFDVGIFLNISPDHIGPIEHPTFEDYLYCKRQLLRNSKSIILNRESCHFNIIFEESKTFDAKVYVYGRNPHVTDVYFETSTENHLNFTVKSGEFGQLNDLIGNYSLKLAGDFNKDNALSAAIATHLLGADNESIRLGIAKTTVPGRMEMLMQKNGASIYVDYAHNKTSLESLIEVVRNNHSGKVIVVIGSTGNKAESRRVDFGQVLSERADIAVLTADDPNCESPEMIAIEIQQAMTKEIPTHIIAERERAIELALSFTENEHDAVVIAGKGADLFQIVNNVREDYAGDFEIAKRLI